jgi:uncharacterized protein YodC (DUF2158 family)
MSQFKPGEVVQLKSGGPAMTVEWCEDRGGEQEIACCSWFDTNNVRQKQTFGSATLNPVSDDPRPKLPTQPTPVWS